MLVKTIERNNGLLHCKMLTDDLVEGQKLTLEPKKGGPMIIITNEGDHLLVEIDSLIVEQWAKGD